jgi:hypothetical protein
MGKTRFRNRPAAEELVPTVTIADIFKQKLGWKPSGRSFHTTADRQCGGCLEVLPGNGFDVPVTPGRPDLNTCRDCSA